MKKELFFIITMMMLSTTACGSKESIDESVTEIIVTETIETETNEISKEDTSKEDTSKEDSGIDVDLTTLSSTMVYAEVYNMMMYPENYIGKIIQMEGTFVTYKDSNTGMEYHVVIIQDATACCSQGIEFLLIDETTYPEQESNITVVGEFETYSEGELMYCRLKDATVV